MLECSEEICLNICSKLIGSLMTYMVCYIRKQVFFYKCSCSSICKLHNEENIFNKHQDDLHHVIHDPYNWYAQLEIEVKGR